ncbi:MAG TPA: DUF5752 family protein [Terriglobales bacterium]|nr:DUF5752 family protein [Terriglobales bacterium]
MSAALPNPRPSGHPGDARRPFYFNSSVHLLRIGREVARNLGELLEALRSCPDDSIFQHTFRTLEEHHFIPEGFSNDFAHWALAACGEPALAERLAGVDVREFTSLADLRARIVAIVEDFTRRHPRSLQKPVAEPFYFCAAESVVLPTPFVARNLVEFADALARVSVHSIHHHFIEARLRLKLISNDFSVWLQDELGLPDAARRLNRVDIYTATLEDVRRQIIRVVERALA